MDAADPLQPFRDQFHIPKREDGCDEIYLVGNSLGLQPKQTADYVQYELEQWRSLGVRGHFEGEFPWMPYHEFLTVPMAALVGGRETEVVMMNSLTVNLHLMMATFFRPQGKKCKILMESHAFPSDYHAVESQLRWHGLDPRENLIQVRPDHQELISSEWLLEQIESRAEELAMVLLPGVQYYTGQLFDMGRIVEVAHRHGVVAGFDLAHAAGNVPLALHDWDVDFAVWCSYKYLNSGPGSVGGCYVHQRHVEDRGLQRLAGWWGHEKSSRFQMKNEFSPIPTVEGWQLSNPPILSLAAIRSSLQIFSDAGGMSPLREKSLRLTGFLEECLQSRLAGDVRVITPADAEQRGCQLSLAVCRPNVAGREIRDRLEAAGIRTDWREPNGMRCAPVPLYNTFEDVWSFVDTLAESLG